MELMLTSKGQKIAKLYVMLRLKMCYKKIIELSTRHKVMC